VSCLLTVTLHIVDMRLTCLINITYLLNYLQRRVGRFVGNRYPDTGIGTIWLENVRCVGTETHIALCGFRTYRGGNCQHYVSVSCLPGTGAHCATVVVKQNALAEVSCFARMVNRMKKALGGEANTARWL